eukprot:CAMPEP_0167780624 /NCGR_PEP_ID=MMETSP0111_2-20121227/5468_1 /TAXON_ID=91324 /ORGANISM="Lotharella globosa, Strain CCCM811" /LENGTH=34 /DNA_ID= /DNA_START= /DNA_END= /DNA_ORIENTATION=
MNEIARVPGGEDGNGSRDEEEATTRGAEARYCGG